MQFILHGFGRRITDIGREMHLAALPGRALELDPHGIDQTAVVVGDHQIDASETTPFEPGEELAPTALLFTVSELQPQNLAVAIFVDTCRHEGAT